MDLLWFLLFIVIGCWAWTARSNARLAMIQISQLQREIELLRGLYSPPSAEPAPAPAEHMQAFAPAPTPVVASEPEPEPEPPPIIEPEPVAEQAPAAAQAANEQEPLPEPDPAPGQALFAEPPHAQQQPPRYDLPNWFTAAWAWFFEGNVVAKIGLLILFIGVGFLVRYASAYISFPIELRLASIVAVDLAVLTWAWKVRDKNPSVSLPVQGTCMAVLMLVSFAAFRMYGLISGNFAFALLFVLTFGTCLLAVLQNAQWLAIFGIAGGFAAPILASSGQGNHIALFSYYALLNTGILFIALKRSWRALNLLGFAFTFSIGTAWALRSYDAEYYLSVQLFLALFFVYYVGIAIAYALLQAPRLKSYVDGTLVFGTPMLAASLQFSLVKHMEFGMAYSALAFALFYGVLASVLARRRQLYGMMVDVFVALAVVFGTLAIPFALDGRWTSAAWALEGAGIVWIGLRQRQPMAWGFGLLVQLGAWVRFLAAVSSLDHEAVRHENLLLGFLLLSASAFLMAERFRAEKVDNPFTMDFLSSVFLTGASAWLIAGFWTQVLLHSHGTAQANLLVASTLAAAVLLAFIGRRMAWRMAYGLAMTAQLLAGGALLMILMGRGLWQWAPVSTGLFETPFLGALMIMSAAAFTAWALMRQGEAQQALSKNMLIWAGLWWLLVVAPTLAQWLLAYYCLALGTACPSPELQFSAYSLLITATTPQWLLLARRLSWPGLRWSAQPVWLLFVFGTVAAITALYTDNMPGCEAWIAYAALWLMCERLTQTSALPQNALPVMHTLRTAGPWLMIWPLTVYWLKRALQGADADPGWFQFPPAWLMMGALFWTMRRVRADRWPVRPMAELYRTILLPMGCAWSLLLVAIWNITQNGSMAPLPYIPLATPLDLTSILALLLAISCYRQLPQQMKGKQAEMIAALALTGYAWFNLALLRAVAHYLSIPYELDPLFASRFVQAMLSLLWTATALVLMYQAAHKQQRELWITGAVLLGVVVFKLFMIDVANVRSIEGIVSFLGVGGLMVGIGYLAPYPGKGAA